MNTVDRAVGKNEPGALLMRVPGRARSQKKAREAFEEIIGALKRRYKREFWCLFVPKLEDVYRWRVQFDCGCVRELFTIGKDIFPDSHPWTDPIANEALPLGEYWCSNEHNDVGTVYRDVVEWIDQRVREFPADPEECLDYMIPEVWAVLRQLEPHSLAFWRVRLSCGHFNEHVVTSVDWRPEDGPKLITLQRAAEMRRELEGLWSGRDDEAWLGEESERNHLRRMLDLRYPRPEQRCYTCRFARRITGYQRIGWLISRSDPKKVSQDCSEAEKKRAEARLEKIEAEARQLREQLGLAKGE